MTRNRAGAGQRADCAQRRLLRAGGKRRTDHQRSHTGFAAGARLSGNARHPQRRAGGRLEAHHEGRARRGRTDFSAALARRAHLASLLAARRRAAGGAVGDCAGGAGLDARGHEALRDAARARRKARRSKASSRIIAAAQPTRKRPASTALSCTAPTAIWSINSCATKPTGAPTAMAATPQTAPASLSK